MIVSSCCLLTQLKIYIIKELVLKKCSKYYASGGNVERLKYEKIAL
jgi:hypothetical protein